MIVLQPMRGTSSGWREFRDPVRATTVFLHRSGLWFEVDTETYERPAVDGDEVRFAKAIAFALNRGATGQHDVVVYEGSASPTRHVRLERVRTP